MIQEIFFNRIKKGSNFKDTKLPESMCAFILLKDNLKFIAHIIEVIIIIRVWLLRFKLNNAIIYLFIFYIYLFHK